MALESIQLWMPQQLTPVVPTRVRLGAFQVAWTQLHTGLSAGVWQLDVGFDGFNVRLLPTRGMSIDSVSVGNVRFGWDSPIPGPVHPQFVSLDAPDGLGWLCGFTELLVRCGLNSNGAPQFSTNGQLEFPLHGCIGNLPAQSITIQLLEKHTLEITAEVHEARFHYHHWRLTTQYRLYFGKTHFDVLDSVTNLSGRQRDFQLLYHFNLGHPLLEPGGRVHLGANEVAPRDANTRQDCLEWNRIHAPRPGEPEQVFFLRPKCDAAERGLALLTNAARSLAAGIEFDTRALPCFTLWKNYADPRDGYVIGLEPGTNFPNTRQVEARHGRTRWLEPGETALFPWTAHFAVDLDSIAELIQRTETVQGPEPPCVHDSPQSDRFA